MFVVCVHVCVFTYVYECASVWKPEVGLPAIFFGQLALYTHLRSGKGSETSCWKGRDCLYTWFGSEVSEARGTDISLEETVATSSFWRNGSMSVQVQLEGWTLLMLHSPQT